MSLPRCRPRVQGKLAELQAARRVCDERAAAAHEARMLHLGHRDGLQAALSRRGDASGSAVEAAEVPAACLDRVAARTVPCL